MNQLETLLNSLIKMGWKPWGFEVNFCRFNIYKIRFQKDSGQVMYLGGMRELVSLESGLWQFVCENRVVKENDDVRIKNYQGDNECDTNCCYDDYEYRLIESALVPEDKLGQFLVDNIVMEGV